jgi:hypothetical protein
MRYRPNSRLPGGKYTSGGVLRASYAAVAPQYMGPLAASPLRLLSLSEIMLGVVFEGTQPVLLALLALAFPC